MHELKAIMWKQFKIWSESCNLLGTVFAFKIKWTMCAIDGSDSFKYGHFGLVKRYMVNPIPQCDYFLYKNLWTYLWPIIGKFCPRIWINSYITWWLSKLTMTDQSCILYFLNITAISNSLKKSAIFAFTNSNHSALTYITIAASHHSSEYKSTWSPISAPVIQQLHKEWQYWLFIRAFNVLIK